MPSLKRGQLTSNQLAAQGRNLVGGEPSRAGRQPLEPGRLLEASLISAHPQTAAGCFAGRPV